tara:strand:+ start:2355 stop:2483 length:129 start_codon:yes stop_codon:yes gene_type:complete
MFDKILDLLGYKWARARDSKGRYIPDEKKTKFRNEAWKIIRK